jgi:hypothetical protein
MRTGSEQVRDPGPLAGPAACRVVVKEAGNSLDLQGNALPYGAMDDLFALVRTDAQELRIQFKRASIQGRGTSQDIATFRESALQSTLSNYFPFPFRVAKGGIVDSYGRRSASVDCILVNPLHPYTIDRRENFKLIFAEGVNAAVEVKPDISQKDELYRGLAQGLTVKALRRAETALSMPEQEGEEAVKYSLRVPYFVFAMKAKADPLDTVEEILDFYAEREIDPLDQADAVVIDGVGILHNFPVPAFNYFRQDQLPDPGWFLEFGEDDALANFLTRLTMVVPPVPHTADPVLLPYLFGRTTKVASMSKVRELRRGGGAEGEP